MDGLNGAGVSVPGTRERGSDSCPRDLVLYAECNLPGLKGAAGVCLLAHRSANVHRDTPRYGARHELAFSGQQVPSFLGAGVPAHATWGEMPKAWYPDLRLTDLSGSDSHNPDPVLGSVNGDFNEMGLGSQNSVKTSARITSSADAKSNIDGNRLMQIGCKSLMSGVDPSRAVGRPASSLLDRDFVEMVLLLFCQIWYRQPMLVRVQFL